MLIRRQITDAIKRKMFKGKAIVMVGARQVGKSTLFKQIIEGEKSTLVLNCDEPEVRELLTDANTQTLRLLIADNRIVVIDEAQRVERIGLTLKLIVENFPSTQLLVTGSSSFELKNNLNEPLTGRKYEYHLYPISTQEIIDNFGLLMASHDIRFIPRNHKQARGS